MAKSHYEVLDVKASSTADQIRSAYRKIVLQHHPDRSSDPASTEIFMSATAAYDVLSNGDRRRQYDEIQRLERMKIEQQRLREVAKRAAQPVERSAPRRVSTPSGNTSVSTRKESGPAPSGPKGSMTIEVTRLTMLFGRGQHLEAETLARRIIERDPRQPIPYSVMGDLHRQRGELRQAAKMYAYAAQMDPHNQVYQRRYEELIGATNVEDSGRTDSVSSAQMAMPMLGGALVLLACVYLVLASEPPLFPQFALLSSWTLGLIVMLFLCGVFVGATFSVGRLLDRFSTVATSTSGKLSPSVALAFVAVANFWAAALMYLAMGINLGGFNFSTSRLVGAVAGATLLMSVAAGLSHGLNGWQTLVWGGNVLYFGSLCGWMVADSFRH
jgi:curved DNA-binding protein CbpA